MRLLRNTEFYMQPHVDGYTRKSMFDTILAGCIPIFFHPVSAYLQYTWHLSRDYRSYSVFIPAGELSRNASIEEVLLNIPSEKVAQMREQVIRLIPAVMYRHPAAMGVTFKDAVDVTLERVIHRVAKRRRAANEGREHVDGVDGDDSWKYDLLEDGEEKIGPHEFDQYLYMHVTKDLLA
ncbi:Xyloglucan galactosyltransferase KATAMARI1-like protein [Hordeum vulgare]|nr:Xyloglucan galactosyltransferase KATAMARI1-like protein [Hordeum vulgare]